MFDASWSELLVVAILAVLLLGPKELPVVMRKIGIWLGYLQRTARDFRWRLENMAGEDQLNKIIDKSNHDKNSENDG